MSKDVISLDENDDIQNALDKFNDINLMSLPVTDDQDQIVGTLALYEIVEWFKQTMSEIHANTKLNIL